MHNSMLNDVIVLTLPVEGANSQGQSFVAALVAGACAPVLAVPSTGPTFNVTGAALVAWDGSQGASAAVRLSVPLLAQASAVHLVEFGEHGTRSDGNKAAFYLSRHCINSNVHHRLSAGKDAGSAIVQMAGKLDVTTIVMGAYGHSRTREFFRGGATRTVLASSSVPVFLAHWPTITHPLA